MSSAALIGAITGIAGKALERFVADPDKREQIKAEIALEALKADQGELQAATRVIVAEAGGESWLQRNWRPILMLWFAGLVGAHWLGFTPDNLPESVVNNLLDIVQVGVAGYVVGRSGEKIMREYKRSD